MVGKSLSLRRAGVVMKKLVCQVLTGVGLKRNYPPTISSETFPLEIPKISWSQCLGSVFVSGRHEHEWETEIMAISEPRTKKA